MILTHDVTLYLKGYNFHRSYFTKTHLLQFFFLLSLPNLSFLEQKQQEKNIETNHFSAVIIYKVTLLDLRAPLSHKRLTDAGIVTTENRPQYHRVRVFLNLLNAHSQTT